MNPLVSVVIPTFDRPREAVEATCSALAQSLRAIEVIVVVDDSHEATLDALSQIDDSRLRVTPLGKRLGPGGARNTGVTEARAEWIAFLDDDDRWKPAKLEIQMQAARSSRVRYPVVASRLVARGGGTEVAWPRRLPSLNEHLSEYLLTRRSLFWGEGLVHTSTLLTRKELLERVRFRVDLKKHEDWDWLLRAATLQGVEVVFAPTPEPLALWSTDSDRPRASTRPDWCFSLVWLRESHALVTRRAYASCLLTVVSADAAEEHAWRAFWMLPWEAVRNGHPMALDWLVYLGIWLVPRGVRGQASARCVGADIALQRDRRREKRFASRS